MGLPAYKLRGQASELWIIERLAREYEDCVDFYKVNIDNPDAVEFIDRYEVNSVPLTVFLWDPKGDATVKHSVERGLMGYDELKQYIEDILDKQFKQSTYNVPSSLDWSSGSTFYGEAQTESTYASSG